MDVTGAGVLLATAEVDDLIGRLAAIARADHVTALGEPIAWLVAIAADIAAQLRDEDEARTMTAKEYSHAFGVPVRTVRYRCQRGHLPATKRDGERWIINMK